VREINKLDPMKIKALGPGRHADGNGLYLHVRPTGKTWVFRYRRRVGTNGKGKQHALRDMGLGSIVNLTLAKARIKVKSLQVQLSGHDDPLKDRQVKRAAANAAKTFGAYVEDFLTSTLEAFRNEKHKAQWRSTLKTYAASIWTTPLNEITTNDLVNILRPIWHTKSETARRVRQRIERVLSAAKAQGLRDGENPARLRDNIQPILGKQHGKSEHHAAIPWADMPAFMRDLSKLNSTSAYALEFAILTAARSGEVREATWQEIDLKAAVWTIPASRMKAGKLHRIPLSPRAVAILQGMKRGKAADYVFPGAKARAPLSDAALLECLRGLRDNVTTHGFRSSFKDWCMEKSAIPNADPLSELALAHALKDKTKAAYFRGDALEMRTPMMAAWASFLAA
jgi:integrase